MSVRVMSLVWQLDLPDSQKIVLLALADSANDEGHCWPSMASLTRKCSKGERTIQGVIKELVTAGHLTRQEVPGKGCNYYIHPRSDCAPAISAPPQGTTKTPAAAADKPSGTINKGSGKRTREKTAFPDWLPLDEWRGFVAMRITIKKPLTDRAIAGVLAELERLRTAGNDPGKVLDQSTRRCWRDVYELKERDDGRSHQNIRASNSNGPDKRTGLAVAIDDGIDHINRELAALRSRA